MERETGLEPPEYAQKAAPYLCIRLTFLPLRHLVDGDRTTDPAIGSDVFHRKSSILTNSISSRLKSPVISERRRRKVISQYFESMSTPMLFREAFIAASIVVPVPQNGSRTVSP
jgi:hypothetical protein